MSNIESLPEPRRSRAVAVSPSAIDIVHTALKSGNVEMYREAVLLMKELDAFAALKAFNNALADAKAELPIIKKNSHVKFENRSGEETNYWHEDLAEVVDTVVPILSQHGLSHRWRLRGKPGEPVTVFCIISHRDGHFEENELSAGADTSGGKNPIQGVKSAVSYLERITLMASLGLASRRDDDDGRGTHPSTAPRDEQRQEPPRSDFPGDRVEQSANVTAAEAAHLRHLLKEKGAAESDFLKWAKRESVEQIPADKFDRCVKAINGYTGSTAQ